MNRRLFVKSLVAVGMTASGRDHAEPLLQFVSNKRPVRIDMASPAGAQRRPAVMLLHGRGGMSDYGADFRRRAERLVARGFAAFTPCYFQSSGSVDSPEVTQPLFEIWRRALGDALEFISRMPQVDPGRIGVVGVSLGGFIAGAQAAVDERIAALVSESSGLSSWFPASPKRMPPSLGVHSRADRTVPLADAEKLADVARRFGVEPEMAIFDGDEHLLTGASALCAIRIEEEFLERVLRP